MADDIYTAIAEKEEIERGGEERGDISAEQTPYNKEEYAARKKAEREDAYAEIERATERISTDPVAFNDYLSVMARFPRYSVANTLLIFEQMPEATRLGDFETWKRQGASVKQGQKALVILEPGDEYTRDDGSIGVSYNVKKVFNERQTSARHLEPRHPDMRTLLLSLIEASPVSIKTVDVLDEGNKMAVYNHDSKTITVAKGLDEQPLFKALAIQVAQATLAQQADNAAYSYEANKDTAQLAAYVVTGRYGVDNPAVMPVLASQAPDGTPVDTRAELTRIRETAKTISDRMDKSLEATRPQQEAAHALKPQSRGERDDSR